MTQINDYRYFEVTVLIGIPNYTPDQDTMDPTLYVTVDSDAVELGMTEPKEFVLKKTKKVEVIVELPVHPIPAQEKRAMVKALSKLHEKVQQLSRMECNYPIGQPSKPDFTYCFAPVTQYGKSYCDEHCDLCFSKPASRVKRPNYAPSGSGRRFR